MDYSSQVDDNEWKCEKKKKKKQKGREKDEKNEKNENKKFNFPDELDLKFGS